MQVLVVDDDTSLRDSLVRFVQSKGYTAIPASNALEAFAALQLGGYSAVITDVSMPGGSGIDLLQMMTRSRITPPTYVHSGDSVFFFNSQWIFLSSFISEHFNDFAIFQIKGGSDVLKTIGAFLESIEGV